MAGVAAGGIAGCAGATSQSFEATPVVLTEDGRGETTLAETSRDSSTATRRADAVDGEVSITSHSAVYERGPARGTPTLLESFLGLVNDTPGSGSAVVVAGSDVGLDEVTMDGFEDPLTVAGDRASLVLPEALRSASNETRPSRPSGGPMALAAVEESAAIPDADIGYVTTTESFFPSKYWLHVDDPYGASPRWIHEDAPFVSDGGATVYVALGGHAPEDVFGRSASELGLESSDGGERSTGNNPFLVATPATTAFGDQSPYFKQASQLMDGGDQSPYYEQASRLMDLGRPAPLGGATFRSGVVSTPAAEVGGQSLNPLAEQSFEEMLTGKRFGHLIGPNRAPKDPDASGGVDWLAGPTAVTDNPDATSDSPDGTTVEVLGQEAELRSVRGVVDGDGGPWAVGVHLARVEHEGDVVVAAGSHGWPVGSGKYFQSRTGQRYTGILGSIFVEARRLTSGVDERLVQSGGGE